MNKPSLPSRRKKDLQFYDHVSWRILLRKCEKPSIKSWLMACFPCNTTENFIFSLKYCQQKVDPNTSRKSHVFGTIRHFIFTSSYLIRKYHIYAKKRICGMMLLPYIFLWRKAQKIWFIRETETYENKRKYDLFCTFHKFS